MQRKPHNNPDPAENYPIAVEIRGVSKKFDNVVALDNVSLKIRKGEFFSLLGPSGCGKTTLLRVIGGLELPSSGELLIDGKNAVGQPPYLRSTNMIFQHLALFPHMTVFDNVAFGLRMKKVLKSEIHRKVKEALALIQLEGFGNRKIQQLSGGQQQRVAMARGLVNDPSVLLLDEPLGALDLQLRLQMQVELRRLHRSLQGTFIFVTHDQSEAMVMSNRIAVMKEGQILQVGKPEEIYEQPKTKFVAAFIGYTNLLKGRVVEQLDENRYLFDGEGLRFFFQNKNKFTIPSEVSLSLRYEKLNVGDPDFQVDQPFF
jgi:spermidine/putrescine transport system ATP-binding protein